MNKKYRIYRIWIAAKKIAIKCDHELNDLEEFRKETARTYKVEPNQVKLQYEADEKWDDLKHPIPPEK